MSGSKVSLRLQQRNQRDITPPLTPDDNDDLDQAPKEESPPPTFASSPSEETSIQPETPPVQLPQREIDPAFEDYLVRSRRTTSTDLSSSGPENLASWSWSQLKEPVWVVASYPHHPTMDANDRGLSELYLPRKASLPDLPSTRPLPPS